VSPSCAAVAGDTLEENAGAVVVVVVELGTVVVEVVEGCVVVELGTVVVEVVEGCVVVDERAAGRLLLQLAKRTARTIEPRASATCFRTTAFSRFGTGRSISLRAMTRPGATP
jgi:hypothetical protein